MSVAVITGSAGLIGSEAARAFARQGLRVVGIDNDMRATFFGQEASTRATAESLGTELAGEYVHRGLDVRERGDIDRIFAELGTDIEVVVHTAAQPSHDWAAREPFTDFDINAVGTLNLLESTRTHCPEAVFIFTSTNKVYGDRPNTLPFIDAGARYELEAGHEYFGGIPEDMPIDASLHSLFGASKVAADVLVQEYGRYFGMKTACFRGGTLTGPAHAATRLHGFLAYVMRCAMTDTEYTIYGYEGKQVRDAIHSADLIRAFLAFFQAPRSAAVYNIGGGRTCNASVLEAIEACERVSGKRIARRYEEVNRIGDHIWWISDNGRFERDYPGWKIEIGLEQILSEIHEAHKDTWRS